MEEEDKAMFVLLNPTCGLQQFSLVFPARRVVSSPSPSNRILLFQLQSLVGFEKTIKHLDNHLVEIGTKVKTWPPSSKIIVVWHS